MLLKGAWRALPLIACRLIALSLAAAPAIAAPAYVESFVALSVNLQPRGDVLVLLADDGEVLMREEDFKALDIKASGYRTQLVEGVRYVPLRSVKGLEVKLDLATLELGLRFDPRLLAHEQIVDLAPQRRPGVLFPPGAGAFVNYNLTAAGTDGQGLTSLGAAGELGWRFADWLFLSDGFVADDRVAGHSNAVRLSSSLIRDDRENLRRTVLGDFVSTNVSALGSTLRLGGLSVSKRYAIDPYVVRFPGQIIRGTVTLPSEVFLYSNGVLVRREQVPPGTFELRNIINTPGLNVTDVVIRDVLGNEQQVADPYYFTDQLLREGFDEYSVDLGVERRAFGTASNDYGKPGFSAFYRRGINDALTFGVRGEALDGRGNGGPLAQWRLGTLGVVSGAVSLGSGPLGHGQALALGHTYTRVGLASSIAWRGESRRYAHAASDAPGPVRSELAGNLGFAVGGASSWSLNFLDSRAWNGLRNSAIGATWRRLLGRGAYLSLGARHTSAPVRVDEVLVALTFSFDAGEQRPSVTLEGRQAGDMSRQLFQVYGAPVGREEGLYYRATLDRTTDEGGRTEIGNGFLQYNFAKAAARAEYNQDLDGGLATYNASLSGAIAGVGGAWGASRSVTDSFGVVEVDRTPGVRVYANHTEVGRTDESGRAFVPRLASSFENAISIDDRDLPIDMLVPRTQVYVVPATRSGVLVNFAARRVQAVAGKLVRNGAPFGPAEGELQVDGRRLELYAAREGRFYVEDVPPGRYRGSARKSDAACDFELDVPATPLPVAELGEVRCQ